MNDMFTELYEIISNALSYLYFPAVLFVVFIIARRATRASQKTRAKSYLTGIIAVLILAALRVLFLEKIGVYTDYSGVTHFYDKYNEPAIIEKLGAGIEWFIWYLPPTLLGIYNGLQNNGLQIRRQRNPSQ